MAQHDGNKTGRDVKTLFDALGLDASRYQETTRKNADERDHAGAQSRWPLLGDLDSAFPSESRDPRSGSPVESPLESPSLAQTQAWETTRTAQAPGNVSGLRALSAAGPTADPFARPPSISGSASRIPRQDTNPVEPKRSLAQVLGLSKTRTRADDNSGQPSPDVPADALSQFEPENLDTSENHLNSREQGDSLKSLFARLEQAQPRKPDASPEPTPQEPPQTNSGTPATVPKPAGLASIFARLRRKEQS